MTSRYLLHSAPDNATPAAARAEGLGPTPFTAPHPAMPPEGSPT
jgi:hypothetical protein